VNGERLWVKAFSRFCFYMGEIFLWDLGKMVNFAAVNLETYEHK